MRTMHVGQLLVLPWLSLSPSPGVAFGSYRRRTKLWAMCPWNQRRSLEPHIPPAGADASEWHSGIPELHMQCKNWQHGWRAVSLRARVPISCCLSAGVLVVFATASHSAPLGIRDSGLNPHFNSGPRTTSEACTSPGDVHRSHDPSSRSKALCLPWTLMMDIDEGLITVYEVTVLPVWAHLRRW